MDIVGETLTTSDTPNPADTYAAANDCDVILYTGPVERPHDDTVIDQCNDRKRHKNALLILTTFGGNADAAYRIARMMQRSYEHFTVFVPGYCKSAGTLIAVGANELVLSRHAELGPLDVQVKNADEVGERSSGLTPGGALSVLEARATNFFDSTFRHLRFRMGLPTQKATDASAALVGSLYSRVFSQVDPMRLGELDRANRIGFEYGQRLNDHAKNLKENMLVRLMVGYPSHGFVIDTKEAEDLFETVRTPTMEEEAICAALKSITRTPPDGRTFAFYLNADPSEGNENGTSEHREATPGVAHEAGGDDSEA